MERDNPYWGKGRRHEITEEDAKEANDHIKRLARSLGGLKSAADDLADASGQIVKERPAQDSWFDEVRDQLYTMGGEYDSERDYKRNRNALRKLGLSRVGKMRASIAGDTNKHAHPRSGGGSPSDYLASSVVL